MKKIIAIVISILLFVPSFVYAEGGNRMALKSITQPKDKANKYVASNTNNSLDLSGLSNEQLSMLYPGDVHAGEQDKLPNYESGVNTDSLGGSSDSSYDYQAQIKAMLEAQRRAQMQALQSQRDSTLSELNTGQAGLADTYYNKRNQAAARSDVGALNFAQFMAARNIQGGQGAMPEIYRNNALQGQIGALDQQEAADNANYETQKANVNNAYDRDLANIENNLAAQELQLTMNQMNADKAAALEQQRYDTQMKTAADNTAYNRLQDTKSEYAQNIGQFAADFLAQYNKVKNDGDPSNDWQLAPLAAARQEKLQGMEEAQATQNKTMEANAWKLFDQTGIANDEIAKILAAYGVTPGMTTTQYYNAHKAKSGGSSGTSLSW